MYKARLNTPGAQYWVKSFDANSEKLELTNITADAARLDDTWELYNEGHETGDPLWYRVKVQTPEKHKSMIDTLVAGLKYRAIPKEAEY